MLYVSIELYIFIIKSYKKLIKNDNNLMRSKT